MSSGDYVELSGTEPQPVNQLENVVTIEFADFIKYLSRIVTLHFEEDETPPAFQNALQDAKHQECIKKFISDPQVPVLYIQRSSIKDEDTDQTESAEDVTYHIKNEVVYTPKRMSIIFVKRGMVLEANKPIRFQVRLINFSEDSPYETLHAFVSKSLAPYFKSYIKESGKAEREGDKMAPFVEKKIMELEMGLLHLQQNIDIPEITLQVHPTVANVIKKCNEEGRKPKVADFGDLVEDSSFLDQLQNGVNQWIKEIQKVTKLDRDPSSGTALQEISFWLNLERALHRIQKKWESTEVTLTLDVLKHGKRFHATVSFDTDTLLKQALATVNDYNPLMKDFPINDLLSATELDRIQVAVSMIFYHLRKIPSTKYPIQRALRLVEAISRDLSTQLLKVLETRLLMHKPFHEFEKVLTQCFDIFTTWEDEYDELQGLLRDIIKKKTDENIKMVWRIHPSYELLQNRMEQMRKFRRQHEQLRSVIVRVLRPAPTTGKRGLDDAIPVDEVEGSSKMIDTADATAIEELNLAYEYVKEVDCLDISREGNDLWDAAVRRYEDRIDRVEVRITDNIMVQLGSTSDDASPSSHLSSDMSDDSNRTLSIGRPEPPPAETITLTRLGRLSKPPDRFSPEEIDSTEKLYKTPGEKRIENLRRSFAKSLNELTNNGRITQFKKTDCLKFLYKNEPSIFVPAILNAIAPPAPYNFMLEHDYCS